MQEFEITQLLEQCQTGEALQQAQAIMRLIDLQDDIAVPVILDLVNSPDETIRSLAAEALGRLGSEKINLVGSALINLLTDPEELVRSEAIDSLGLLSYKPARNLVESLLINDPDEVVRASAAETLRDINDAESIEPLKLSMQDPEEMVRAYSAISLGVIGISELLPDLQFYIDSEHSLQVKAELLGAKYRLDKTATISPILNILETSDEDLAPAILNCLADLINSQALAQKLTNETEQICRQLNLITQKFPILKGHTQQIMTKLSKLKDIK